MLAVLSFSNALVSPLGGLAGDRLNNLLVLRLGSLLILAGLIALFWLGPSNFHRTPGTRLCDHWHRFWAFSGP